MLFPIFPMLDKLSGAELQRLLDGIGAPLFMVEVRRDGFAYIGCNSALARYSGLRPEHLLEKGPDDVAPPAQADQLKRHYRRCVETRAPVEFDEFLDLPTGSRWWRVALTPVFDEADRVIRLLGIATDVTGEKEAVRALRYQNLLLKQQQEATREGIVVADEEGRALSWNQRFKDMWGLPDELLHQPRGAALAHALTKVRDPQSFERAVVALREAPQQDSPERELELLDGRTLVWHSRALVEEGGVGRGRIWFFRDITEQRQLENRLRETLALQEAILASASQAIFTVDAQGLVHSFNAAAERLLGRPAAEVVQRLRPLDFHDPQEVQQRLGAPAAEAAERLLEDPHRGRTVVQEWLYVHRDGSRIPVELTLAPLRDEQGRDLGVLGVATDIRERKAFEQRLRELATTDALTGMWNRRHFGEMAVKSIGHATRSGAALSVLMFDIDHFKRLNDTYGHAAGDAVLRAIGQALPQCLRTGDLWCRWGGEEFAALLVDSDLAEATEVAQRLRDAVQALQVRHEGQVLQATVSIGVARWKAGETDLGPAQRRADAALYRAKHAGRNRVVVDGADASL